MIMIFCALNSGIDKEIVMKKRARTIHLKYLLSSLHLQVKLLRQFKEV